MDNPQECYFKSLDTPDYANENALIKVGRQPSRRQFASDNYDSDHAEQYSRPKK
jgi:hypothetical protein